MPPDELPRPEDPAPWDPTAARPTSNDDDVRKSSHDASPRAPAEPGDALPPLLPFHTASPAERPLPRGCHPLVFGVVLATIQFAATCYFMPSCGHPQG